MYLSSPTVLLIPPSWLRFILMATYLGLVLLGSESPRWKDPTITAGHVCISSKRLPFRMLLTISYWADGTIYGAHELMQSDDQTYALMESEVGFGVPFTIARWMPSMVTGFTMVGAPMGYTRCFAPIAHGFYSGANLPPWTVLLVVRFCSMAPEGFLGVCV